MRISLNKIELEFSTNANNEIIFFNFRVEYDDNANTANLANSAVLKLIKEEERQQNQPGGK